MYKSILHFTPTATKYRARWRRWADFLAEFEVTRETCLGGAVEDVADRLERMLSATGTSTSLGRVLGCLPAERYSAEVCSGKRYAIYARALG